ncbi:MAG: hypothetical protein C0442_10785, partial [Chlorobiaceae bacterium]|nr:hypothetical protein [Chlorobiaceae bacterium]
MSRFFLFCSIVFLSINLIAKEPEPKNISPKIVAQKLIGKIILDGKLDEQIWQTTPINNFTQRQPNEGKAATEKTHVWIAYDESYLYFAAKLYDTNPDSIVGRLARRDNFIDSDWFGIFLDPYFDKKTGFFFAVNPIGTQVDGTLFNDGWDDPSWNGVWESATLIDEDGWNVEIKIPFSQLRFKKNDAMIWGINLRRDVYRKNEHQYFVMIPKSESGFVSKFAELHGLNEIKPSQRLEIFPYIVSKAQYLVHDANDPFYKQNQYKLNFGTDAKIGIGTNLNLDLTINPDFGQVEVDPAVINLTAFESFFEEKRPFFIEGANIFYFGVGGANNNWGFNFGWPQLFYSRRIGRAPQGSVSDNDFVNYPTETRILGAAKLTGKLGSYTEFGGLSAITERTFATLDNNGIRSEEEVEPATHYGVYRARTEFNDGRQALGFYLTSVNRDLNNKSLQNRLAKNAFTLGLDGWTFLDDAKGYVLTGAFVASHTQGTKDYLVRLQERPYRYFQRPDATYATLDSNLNSLSGYYGRMMLNKQEGNFYFNTAVGLASPGFENNDLGFQYFADRINSHLVLGYRWFEPDNFFRSKNIYTSHSRSYDFEGNIINSFLWLRTNFQFLNYWGFGFGGNYNFETINKFATRGGPLVISPERIFLNLDGYTDSRKKIVGNSEISYSSDRNGGYFYSLELSLDWRPLPQLNVNVGPSYDINRVTEQWVGKFSDNFALNTFKNRYVFAQLDQTTLAGNIRLDWTFTPQLSLQLFLQPLFSVGSYSYFKELAKPKSKEYNVYGRDNSSSINYNDATNEYTVEPDGEGAASSFVIDNPDFNFKSLRANGVLRWEFKPGSTLFFVWTQSRTNPDHPSDFSFERDFRSLINSESDNIFMIKFTYWF